MKLARVLGHAMAWHVTFAVNSLCHDAKEEDHGPPVGRSRDIGALCLLSCGDAYHAAHHARARRAPRARRVIWELFGSHFGIILDSFWDCFGSCLHVWTV